MTIQPPIETTLNVPEPITTTLTVGQGPSGFANPSIDALSDVVITGAANGQLLRFNGTNWVNWTPNYLELSGGTIDGNLTLNNDHSLGWSDVFFSRDAAHVVAQRNSTNAQLLRVYGSYTNNANYRRLKIGANNNTGTFEIRAEGLGTGVNNNKLDIICGAAGAISAGNFTFYDSGALDFTSLTVVNGILLVGGDRVEPWNWSKDAGRGDGVSFLSTDVDGEDDGNDGTYYRPQLRVNANNDTGFRIQRNDGTLTTALQYDSQQDAWNIGNPGAFRSALKITVGTDAPTGGEDGDIYIQYLP